MVWFPHPYTTILLCFFVVSTVLAWAAWQRRPTNDARAFAILMVGVAGLLGVHALEIESQTFDSKVFWAQFQWIFAAIIPPAFLVFALEYTGRERWVTRRTLALLAVEPIVQIGLLTTNDATGLLWGSPTTAEYALGALSSTPVILAEPDPNIGVFVHVVYAGGCYLLATVLLVGLVVRSNTLYRSQGVFVIVGILAPWIGGTLTAVASVPNVAPIAFAITGIAFTLGFYRYRLLDIAPIARADIIENFDGGVVVVDDRDTVVDANLTAREVLELPRDELVGTDLETAFAAVPVSVGAPGSATQSSDENPPIEQTAFAIDDDEGGRHFELGCSRIRDGRGTFVGWNVVFYDVTERERRERELEWKNRKLDEFASVVSHDLRNPLNVAQGYLELLREECNSPHIEDIEHSHDRMERLIDDVLALAREGATALEREPVNLDQLARKAWTNVETSDATLIVESEQTIDADAIKVEQLLENLFRNSIEHGSPAEQRVDSRADSPLSVRVEPLEDRSGFAVSDSGVGLPDTDTDAIFESGYTTNEHGTGFGLSIVTEIADLHGWTVAATDGEDGGARFELAGVRVLERQTDPEPGRT
ncbi:histidine kinase N-terminal 7TM domain-containing protein [Natronoglomus mannanivorans]|uniref:histidine kinase n=1 Tax=Natronoglomus mannanivorans TaxID=2979990 RepID=A0AAP3E278_9EURY|nr:ATP-binding protein [Halobacteria archaeon AArc-xg1-1]